MRHLEFGLMYTATLDFKLFNRDGPMIVILAHAFIHCYIPTAFLGLPG